MFLSLLRLHEWKVFLIKKFVQMITLKDPQKVIVIDDIIDISEKCLFSLFSSGYKAFYYI